MKYEYEEEKYVEEFWNAFTQIKDKELKLKIGISLLRIFETLFSGFPIIPEGKQDMVRDLISLLDCCL